MIVRRGREGCLVVIVVTVVTVVAIIFTSATNSFIHRHFGSVLIHIFRYRMSAKERKRTALYGLRDLATEVGVPASRRKVDLSSAEFDAFHALVVAACTTEAQKRRTVDLPFGPAPACARSSGRRRARPAGGGARGSGRGRG